MNRVSTKKIVLNGLMLALVFLATYFTRIPTPLPGGYFNLGDAVIIITAIILGRTSGLIAGALGSFMADIASGAFLFAPVTLIVKGIEGFVVGTIAHSVKAGEEAAGFRGGEFKRMFAAVVGAVIMVAGYFLAEAYILGFFDKEFGIAAAVTELVPNLVQGGLSAVLGYALSELLIKVKVFKE